MESSIYSDITNMSYLTGIMLQTAPSQCH